jgi:hypothetical protein
MKRLANILLILMVVVAAAHPGFARDENQGFILSDDQAKALALINEIRKDPLVYAEKIGYDRDTLRRDLPWLVDVLDKGLHDCSPSEVLSNLAQEKNSLAQQNVIEEPGSQDEGEPVKIPFGSDPALTGEMGGVVSFYSFMPPDFAWEIVIRNQFEQELKQDIQIPLCILNPGFDSMGLSMRGGRNEVGGEVKNAYFATICFASSRLKAEAQVLNMVNQVRFNPDSIETYMGVSLFKLLNYNFASVSEWFWLYPPLRDSANLPPLFENTALHESARYRVTGMVNPDALSLQGIDSTPLKYEIHEGKEESFTHTMVRPDATSDYLSTMLFTSLLGGELMSPLKKGAIFSIRTNEGGVGIALSQGEDRREQAGVVLHAHVASVDEPSSVGDLAPGEDQARIYGVVFFDIDGNEIYSPGEGKERTAVNVFRQSDNALVDRAFTDASGYFSANLESYLEYRFEISSGETQVSFLKVVEKNLFLPVNLSSQ